MVRSLTRILLVPLLGAAFFGTGPNQARAAIIATPVGVVGAPEGDNFRYTYSLTLVSDSLLLPPDAIAGDNAPGSPAGGLGNLFTYYDVFGFVPGSASVTGLLLGNTAFVFPLSGLDPPGTDPLPPDNPAVLNITVMWTGAPVPAPPGASVLLGTLSFLSTNPFDPADPFAQHATAAATQDFTNPVLISNNIEQVPGPGTTPPDLIPEPASLLALACGVPLAMVFVRRRNRKQAQ